MRDRFGTIRRCLLAGMLTMVFFGTGASVAAAPAAPEPAEDLIGQVILLVNRERQKHGVPALVRSQALEPVAATRAQEAAQLFAHTRPSGLSWETAFVECGISQGNRGENLAFGQASAMQVVQDWMHSSSHRENLLSPYYTETAVGLYFQGDTYYWSQAFFADPESDAPFGTSEKAHNARALRERRVEYWTQRKHTPTSRSLQAPEALQTLPTRARLTAWTCLMRLWEGLEDAAEPRLHDPLAPFMETAQDRR